MPRSRILSWLAAALWLAASPAPHAQEILLPSMGDSAGALISPEQERRLGEGFMRSVRQALAFVDDPIVNEYIQSLGQRLVAESEDPYQQFTFFVIQDHRINAFAAPGGFVGVNSGLITATDSESELASVIAHEIAHVTQHHLARAYEAYTQMSIPALAGMVAAIVMGTQNPEAGAAALAAVQATQAQHQLDFTRANEKEADRIGIKMLAGAGYDPRSMPTFFERLQRENQYYGNLVPEFLSTHPVTASRIADSRNRAEQYPYRQITDSLAFHLVRARLRVMQAADPAKIARALAAEIKLGQYRNEEAARYGYALALLQSHQYERARDEINRLLKIQRDLLPYRILAARLAEETGNLELMDTVYKDSLKLYPNNHALTMYYSRALLNSGRYAEARDMLEAHSRSHRSDPELYKLLANAQEGAGNRAAAHAAMAEHYYATGQTRAAIEQLRIAQRLGTQDFYQGSKIEARLRELQDEVALLEKR